MKLTLIFSVLIIIICATGFLYLISSTRIKVFFKKGKIQSGIIVLTGISLFLILVGAMPGFLLTFIKLF